MEQSNPYDKLSLEELIKLAESSTTPETFTDVDEFIMSVPVLPSENRKYAPAYNVYWAYCKWAKAKGLVPLKVKFFLRELKNRFGEASPRYGERQFKVNPEPFELTTEEWWQMRKAIRSERKKTSKKIKKNN